MVPPSSCDVLVVGAGPAGSSAAQSAAKEGAKVLLVDAKTRIGERPHCGEFVPRQVFSELGLDRASIIQPVEKMETLIIDLAEGPILTGDGSGAVVKGSPTPAESPSGARVDPGTEVSDHTETLSPGFLIDRARFDRELAREAGALGVTVFSSARLVGLEADSWIVACHDKGFRVRPKLIVAADGAFSTVGALLGMRNPEVLRGCQVEVPLVGPLKNTFVFLSPQITGGYGWLFPKGIVANVGLGVMPGNELEPPALLERLLDRLIDLGMIRPGILARTGGLIAVSGIREDLVRGNAIFCGDAAGLTHPITGAGIPQALISGQMAGRAAALSARAGERKHLSQYEAEIKSRYRGVISHALAKRHLMMSLWGNSDFVGTCRQTWIAFRGYRKRVRQSQP